MNDALFEQRVRNAFINVVMNHNVYCTIREKTPVTEQLSFLKLDLNNHYMVVALCMDTDSECRLFLDSSAFRFLILDPMTQDVKNAINDYHSIGHGS